MNGSNVLAAEIATRQLEREHHATACTRCGHSPEAHKTERVSRFTSNMQQCRMIKPGYSASLFTCLALGGMKKPKR